MAIRWSKTDFLSGSVQINLPIPQNMVQIRPLTCNNYIAVGERRPIDSMYIPRIQLHVNDIFMFIRRADDNVTANGEPAVVSAFFRIVNPNTAAIPQDEPRGAFIACRYHQTIFSPMSFNLFGYLRRLAYCQPCSMVMPSFLDACSKPRLLHYVLDRCFIQSKFCTLFKALQSEILRVTIERDDLVSVIVCSQEVCDQEQLDGIAFFFGERGVKV